MPQIADRKSMARYICVDKGATHPALQREELPKHMAIYADYGVTGTDLRQRPELNRLLTDCRAGGLLHPLDTGKPQLGVRWNLH